MPYDDGGWPAYVTVTERRRDAARALAKLHKSGQKTAPVKIGSSMLQMDSNKFPSGAAIR